MDILNQYTNARDLFEAARDAYKERTRTLAVLNRMESREGLTGKALETTHKAFDPGAPTATDVRIDYEMRVQSAVNDCDALLDAATAVLYGKDYTGEKGGLYCLLGHVEADILCLHWCQDMTWTKTGEIVGYSSRWCQEIADQAFDYIDGHGFQDVIAGDGGAEI